MTAKKTASKTKIQPGLKAVISSGKSKTGSDKKAIPSKKVALLNSQKPLVARSKTVASPIKKAVAKTKASPNSPATKQISPSSKSLKDPKRSSGTVKSAKTAVKKTNPKAATSKTPSHKTAAKPVEEAAAKRSGKASKKVTPPDKKMTVKKPTSTKTTQTADKAKITTKAPKDAVKKPVLLPKASPDPVTIKPEKVSTPSKKNRKKTTKHFTPAELNVFYATMLALRERLTAQVSELREQSLLRHDEVNQDEDGTDAFERVTSLDRASTDQSQINQINNAILTITKGTYGLCESCGEKIERPRLNALPFAEMCIKCQSELEGDTNRRKPSTDLLD